MNSVATPIQVLHVDDDPDFADLTADFIERQDERITVETATGIIEGLNQLSEKNFDCVISDYDMPDRTGIEFLETVRETDPDLPFILFTGKGSEEIASEAISAGVTDYLQKESGTGQYSVLANRVINAVKRQRTQRDLRASEQRYRQLLEAAPVPILLYSENFEVVHANEAAVEFLNASGREELIGQHAPEFAHPKNEDRVRSRLEQVASNKGQMPPTEVAITALDGSEKYAIASSTPGTYDGEPVVQTVAYDITEQKQQAANYETIFENTPEGIVLHDAADGSFVDMNTRYVDMFGYDSKDEFLEAGFEAIHPGDPPYTLENAAEQVQTAIREGSRTIEWPGVRKDGSEFWAEVHLAPVELHGSDRILAAVRDISERKEREDELRETTRRLDLALNATETGVWEWKMGSDEVFWSESLERLLRIEPGAFAGTYAAYEDYLHPADEQTVEEAATAAIEGEETFEAEFRMIRGDGDVIWVHGRGEYFDDDGPERLLGITTDVTARKERERELERYKTLVEVAGDPMYMLDAEGYIEFVNDIFVDYSGYSEEALVGEHIEMVMDQDDLEEAEDFISSLLADGKRRGKFEMDAITAEGNRIPAENHISLLFEDGEFTCSVGVIRVIRERLERERQLQRERDRLDEFASVVSHDLRNPLSVAQARLQLAIDDGDWSHLESVAEALDRMETLIEDMLTLANAGEAVGDLNGVELSEVADACWKHVETERATLQVDTERTIQADTTRLQQLLENLLRNAVEHGGEEVTVTLGSVSDGFYVEDDGAGIPPDEQAKVLEPGYTSREDGTGFGLSIVRDIAEAHDWQLEVTDGQHGGARFEFTGVETA